MHRALLASIGFAATAGIASAQPVPVSPGSTEHASSVDARCPTFSWGPVRGATGYELVVFELDGTSSDDRGPTRARNEPPPALRVEIPSAALSFTPASDDCLERGRTYAWFVRGTSSGDASDWSEPRQFAVRAAPSARDVEEALETLSRYLEAEAPGIEAADRAQSLAALAAAMASRADSSTSVPDRAGERIPSGGAPDGFDVGLSSRPSSLANGTIGVYGVTESTIDQSVGVFGEATGAMGVSDGVRGVSASTSGTGVRGSANSLNGVTAGLWGSASSPDGFGGFTFNLGLGDPGGTGLFTSGALNDSADLILGGNVFWPEGDQDDGRIHSDPLYNSSDLVLQSNDNVLVWLDHDGEGEDSDFTVVDRNGLTLFNVDQSGVTFIEGDLVITGEPQGGLVSLDDVESLIQNHLVAEHPKLVFVTSSTYNGNLGGLSGADAKCRAAAQSAGLIGIFKAWISGDDTAGEEARDRLFQASVPYRRVDYAKVADSWSDLTDGTLDAAITVDENGNTVTASLTAYTNTDSNGARHEIDRECSTGPGPDWNTSSNLESGGYGTVGATNSTWSWVSNDNCSLARRLYCFQQ